MHQRDSTLRALEPAPEAWVARAQELPQIQRALDTLRARGASGDEATAALRDVGLEPDEGRLRALQRLSRLR